MARQFETGMEDSKGLFVEENEDAVENEDEKDQAKVHFYCSTMESYLYNTSLPFI